MKDNRGLKFIFFALMAWGKGISGGDRISTEFARRWVKSFPVTIYLWEEGYQMYMRQNLNPSKVSFQIIDMHLWKGMGFFINYIARIFAGIFIALKINLDNQKETIVYCATEFWMDSLPGFILKKRFPKITLVNTWFQTAPNPFIGFKEGNRVDSHRLNALAYWLVQLPIKPLIKKFSDFVLVNNEDEKKQFSQMNLEKKVIVVLGAVDLNLINKYLRNAKKEKIYDGVFQGRFHPQKGVVELVDIWKLVVDKKPDAKLALIGDGPLMNEVKAKVKKLGLENNIISFGYLFDGEKKYQIFAQSRVVLHPAFYDSGGMASAEAMALGLPGVSFNLKSYESYYPKGMIKIEINNLTEFAEAVVKLLNNKKLYSKIGNEGKEMISKNRSWDKTSEEVLNIITKNEK